MKEKNDVISDFNEFVNMTASELESWLKSDDSNSAGWPKDDGNGESVGHDSGRKIVEILKSNPKKEADKYTDEQVEHMRKVVAYCKRHLAQEKNINDQKSEEEVKKTKSYASLKNWGHDFLKAKGSGSSSTQDDKSDANKKNGKQAQDQKKEDKEEAGGEDEEEEEEEEEAEDESDGADGEEQTGDKRKAKGQQNGSSKKRETRQGASTKDKDDDDKDEDEKEEDGERDEGNANGSKKASRGEKATNGPSKGDTVSWNWGSGQPKGKVLDVKGEKTTIETKRGNEVSRDGKPDDPAVVLDTGKSKAIKSAHELN